MRINLNKEIGKEAINSYLEILNKQDKLNKYKEINKEVLKEVFGE